MSRWNVPRLSSAALEAMRQLFGDMGLTQRMSEEDKGGLYDQCLIFYKLAQYDKAQILLMLLRIYAPMDYRYMVLHGLCFKQLKAFDDALGQFRLAAMVEPENAEPCLHAAECLMAIGEAQEAGEVLQEVLRLSAGNPKYQRLADRAEGWLALAQAS